MKLIRHMQDRSLVVCGTNKRGPIFTWRMDQNCDTTFFIEDSDLEDISSEEF